MNTLTLDVSKWRCGEHTEIPENRLGTGMTQLLNDEGYMCCLGQFAPQLDPSISDRIKNCGRPLYLNKEIPLLTNQSLGLIKDTEFSEHAMLINDKTTTSVQQKLELLTKLLSRHNYQLEIINHI